MKLIYHSATKKLNADKLYLEEGRNYYHRNGSVAMIYNILNPFIPSAWRYSDVIYCEPSWQEGYKVFCDRAEYTYRKSDYILYLKRIEELIDTLDKPAFIIGGKHMLQHLNPYSMSPIRLLGSKAFLCVYKTKQHKKFDKNFDVISYLAERYNYVLDFCCGYGNTARIFKKAGKLFVCSDFNSKCVYYVAKTFLGIKDV